jgi:hypothetical protein
MANHKDILSLEGKTIPISHNGKVINAEILSVHPAMMGHSVFFHLGFTPVDSIISDFKNSGEFFTVEFPESDTFPADDYFDVPGNEWSLGGFKNGLLQAQALCVENHKNLPEKSAKN